MTSTEQVAPQAAPRAAQRATSPRATLPPASTEMPVHPKPKVRLPWPLSVYQSAVGKKWVMAITGIALLGFVLAHMIGNLHLYEGPVKLSEYAEALRDLGGDIVPRTWILWALRFGLIAAFGLHIHSAWSLTVMSRRADASYAGGRGYAAASYASRTMRWTGPIILLYLFYHLADLTWGWFNPDFVRGDPYHNVVASLSNIPVAILYVVATVALAIHIYHGAWSMFQSLGVNSPKLNPLRRRFAQGFAAVILIGNLSFPIFVQAEVIDDGGVSVVREHEAQTEEANVSAMETAEIAAAEAASEASA